MIQIPATTERGSGLALPLAKGISHLMVILHAIGREWPMTVTQAQVELDEAITHFTDMLIPENLLTSATVEELQAWRDRVTNMRNELRTAATANPEMTLAEYANQPLRDLCTQAWSTLTAVDREITGLNDAQTDPGRIP